MKITIITATYNSEKTLRDTIKSVLSQNYQNYEHLIIDGGSSDNTLEIIKEMEPLYNGKLRYISESDKGIYDAMNKGIIYSKGEVIGILNSDDFLASDNVLSLIAENIKDVDIVYGSLDFVDSSDISKIVRHWEGSQYYPGAFLNGWHPAHPTFYAKKECFNNLGIFDLNFNVSADFELMLRFIEKGQLSNKYIPATFVKMRYGGESTGSLKNIIEGNINVLKAFKKNGFKVPHFYLFKRLAPKAKDLIKHKLHL